MANNPKERQQWIQDELKLNPALSFTECLPRYTLMFPVSRETFKNDWKKAQAQHTAYQSKVNLAKEQSSIALEVKGQELGIKSKQSRVLFYQNQIDVMELQLHGQSKFMFIVGNKPIPSHNSKGEFNLPIEKQNEIRNQIKSYQTEISKIEGDYATIKSDITSNGDSMNLSDSERSARIERLIAKAQRNS